MRTRLKKIYLRLPLSVGLFFLSGTVFAQGPPAPDTMKNTLAQVLVIIILALLLCIGLLANVLIGAAQVYYKKEVKDKPGTTSAKMVGIMLLLLCSSAAFAAEVPAPEIVVDHFGGLSPFAFYTLLSVIGIEVIVLFGLLYNLKMLLRREVPVAEGTVEEVLPVPAQKIKKIWERMNSFRPVAEEADMDLGHDYDGIRELDNRLPPWWLYGFYICIFFSITYLWRYHVSHSAPLSGEELRIEMEIADLRKEEYLKKAANNIDENTVTVLTDAGDLGAGKTIFTATCAACHAADGGGLVGPNLTDKFWLHGGSIQEIFKSIKYGWQDKGMKSWKDDYSPRQIAQLASYITSLQGTKPATPKEAQGTPYEAPGISDSAHARTDSVKIASL